MISLIEIRNHLVVLLERQLPGFSINQSYFRDSNHFIIRERKFYRLSRDFQTCNQVIMSHDFFFVRFCHDKEWQIKMWPDKSKLQERLWFLSQILNFYFLEIQNIWGWDIYLGTKNPVRFPIRISGQVKRYLRGLERSKNHWEGLEGSF